VNAKADLLGKPISCITIKIVFAAAAAMTGEDIYTNTKAILRNSAKEH
jgi:hypothetical protein